MTAALATTKPAAPSALPAVPALELLHVTFCELTVAIAGLPILAAVAGAKLLAEHGCMVTNNLRHAGRQDLADRAWEALRTALAVIEQRRQDELARLKARLVALEAHGS